MTVSLIILASCNKKTEIPEGNISFDDAIDSIIETQPKGELDSEILLTVEGVPVSAAAVKHANVASRSYSGITNKSDEQAIAQINKEVDEFYRLNTAIILLNRKYNLSFSKEALETDIIAYFNSAKQMYQEQFDIILNEYMYQTPYFYLENMILNMGYESLFNYLFGPEGVSEKKTEIYNNVLSEMKKNDFVRAKHILISFPEDAEKDEAGNVVESAKAETLAKATEVLEKVKAGEDFDKLIKEFGEDPGTQSYPDGYFFGKGEMVLPFEETAYSLEIGETSGLVETPFGYHIILRLDIDDPALCNTENYVNAAYAELRDLLVDISSDYKIKYSDNYETRVNEFVDEYSAKTEAEAQTQAELESQATQEK